jgi:amino acid adenylation domain-containing protein
MSSHLCISSDCFSAAGYEPQTLVDLLRWRALTQPDKAAYTFLTDGESEEVTLTYGELDRQARAIGACLKPLVKPGDRVLLLYPPGLDFTAAFFGCLYIGAVSVPAYPPRPNRTLLRLRTIVDDAKAEVALTMSAILARLKPMLSEDSLLRSLRWLATDEAAANGIENEWREPAATHETLAFLQYTSGSTGTPKGVMLSHSNLLHNAALVYQACQHTPGDKYVSWLPTFHDMGFMAGILQPLFGGFPVVLMSPAAFLQRPILWLQAISRYRATTSGGPNFAYDLCVRKITSQQREALDLSSWSIAFNGAEPVRHETLERFSETFGPCGFSPAAFYPCYGLAEATLMVSGSLKSFPPIIKAVQQSGLESGQVVEAAAANSKAQFLVGCGASLSEQRIAIVHPETLTECSPDEIGEIWVAGPSVAQGYWNRPAETERVFQARMLSEIDAGPFLRTGDLGFLKAGELFVTGRLKDLIIIRGLNHYPQDIELTVEKSHLALRPGSGAAFSVEVDGEERLIIAQEVDRHQSDRDAIVESIRRAVADEHELQAHAIVLIKPGSIPKTSSGKIQRHLCRANFMERTFKVMTEWRAPATSESEEAALAQPSLQSIETIQAWLILQVAMKLGVETRQIEADQPISQHGLDSLMAIELKHSIETTLNVVMPMVSFLESLSVAQLAGRAFAQLTATSTPRLIPGPARAAATALESPLSRGQQSLWFLHQLAPESTAYHIASALRITGDLDVAALQRAFQTLVDRHPALRTTFIACNGAPVQRIHEHMEVCFNQADASTWSTASLHNSLIEEAHRPFQLEDGPLLRVNLFTRSARDQILLLTIHHIAVDFWSLAVLMHELGTLYQAETAGTPATLRPITLQYTDYVRWQEDMLASPEGERLWTYWQKQLAGELPSLKLPTDRSRPPIQTYRGDSQAFKLNAGLTEGLKALGRAHGATLYMTLLSAFQALLYRYTNQEAILVGSPTAGRNWVALVDQVGYFVNPVVLRADLSENLSFEMLLDRTRQTVLAALEHQDFPFAMLVERLQPIRNPSQSPLFNVMFVLHKSHLLNKEGLTPLALGEAGLRINLGDLPLESIAIEERVAQVDLTLMMAEVEGGLLASLQYNTDLFDASTVARMGGHFQRLLEDTLRDPSQFVSQLQMLTEAERQQLLFEWNQTEADYPLEGCAHQLFEAQVERFPEAMAVWAENLQLTYRELNERANQLAHHLLELGLAADSVVGLLLPRSPDLVIGLLAVLKAGGSYLPLDPTYPPHRLAFILGDAAAAMLLTEERLWASLGPADQARALCLDRAWPLISQQSRQNPGLRAANLAYLIYTSGSSGQPHGILVGQDSLVNLIYWHQAAFGVTAWDRASQLASSGFDASVWEMWPYLTAGASLRMVPDEVRVSPEQLRDWLVGQAITVSFVPTPVAERLLQLEWPGESRLRVLLTGGDQLHERPGSGVSFKVVNNYGPTEATVVATSGEVQTEAAARAAAERGWPTIGRAIANVRVYVVDEELELVAVGVVGELVIGGSGLARGYQGQAELTAARFVPDPYGAEGGGRLYRTGDLVRYRADGEIEYVGRRDEQVKVRGYRIELGEVEAVVREHGRVRAAVVVAREDQPGEKRLVAYIVAASESAGGAAGGESLSRELQAYLKQRLPEYMVPTAFVELAEMPLTAHGKVDRRALPASEQSRSETEEYVPPRTAAEQTLARIWSEILRLNEVGIHDNFFELGGHSLLATQVISRACQAFEIDLPLRKLFEEPTIAQLAKSIDEQIRVGERWQMLPIELAPRDGPLPFSFAQQRLWFLAQLEPGNVAYNIPVALRLTGPLEIPALKQSFDELIRRHEALRTSFAEIDDQVVQVISPAQPISLPISDLSSLTELERELEVRRLANAEASLPFNLAEGPLLRVELLRLGAEEHVLLVTMHHIVSDGWSMGVLVREVAVLYDAFTSGEPSPLPELAIQYADYAMWQRQWFQGEVLEQQLAYWRQQLADAPSALELPTDHPRPVIQSYCGANLPFILDQRLTKEIKQTCQREGVTLFMMLLAAFQVLLSRYSGQTDVVVGTPIANRMRAETEALIGFFVNTLALRTSLAGEPSWRQVLQRVREVCLGAYAHQDVPFERLVDELQPQRNMSHTPLFQVMLVLQNATREEQQQLRGLRLSEVGSETQTAKFDLTLILDEAGETLNGAIEYNTDLFEAATVRRLGGHYERLLESLVTNSGQLLREVQMLSESERHQIMYEWNQKTIHYPQEVCLHQLFEAQVERTPLATALICGEQRVSYEELNRRSNQLAHYLRGVGVGPESLVGVCVERTVEMVVALLGVLKAGGAYVPLDPGYPKERLSYMLGDSGAGVVVTQESLRERLPEQEARVRVISMDGDAKALAEESEGEVEVGMSAENLAYLIYTSGSTGQPKGVAIEHRSAVALVEWAGQFYSAAELGGVLASTSICFDLSVFELFAPLSWGGRVLLVENALSLSGMSGAGEVRLINTVPSAMAELVRLGVVPETAGTINLAGEPIRAGLVEEVYEQAGVKKVYNLYGPTEDTTYSSVGEVVRGSGKSPGIGRAIANTQMYIVDGELELVPVGVNGEICLGGAGLARGYYGRSEQTAERFVPDGYSEAGGRRLYRTGDIGRYGRDGEVEYVGRRDEQVKVRGYRIELGEVEAVLREHSGVREAVVVVREEVEGEKRLVAYVVGEGEGGVGKEAELRSYMKQRLPGYMVPTAFVELAEMPLTANGKVDRRALPQPNQSDAEMGKAYVAPRTPVEEIVAGIWSEVLGVKGVSLHDNFFDLGGHSLLATQAVSRLRRSFGVEIPLRSLFESPTAEALSEKIELALGGEHRVATRPLLRAERDRPAPLSLAQQRLWFLDRMEPGSGTYNIAGAVRIIGRLNVRGLEEALNEVERRHEALRTKFVNEQGRAAQEIMPARMSRLHVEELKQAGAEDRRAAAELKAAEEAAQGFDLSEGRLWRTRLLRLGEAEHVLLLTIHHIVSDGWSISVLMREVAALYEAFSQGKESPLEELPIQYADYAVWQREQINGGDLDTQLEYWKRRLTGAPQVLELPADRARAAAQTFRGAIQSTILSQPLSVKLKQLSRTEGVTLFMTLLAAWQTLLSRYTGETDIVVGTPIANRNREELEGLIGCFINTLVLRTDLSGDPDFRELLRRTREATLGAYEHQDVAFEKLLEALQPERNLNRTPLFQVYFNMLNFPEIKTELSGLTIDLLSSSDVTSKFDLTLYIKTQDTGTRLDLVYNTDLFDRARMIEVLEQYNHLLSQIAERPEERISRFSLVTPAAKTTLPNPAESLDDQWEGAVQKLFSQQARRVPDRFAVIDKHEAWTYKELDSRSSQLANYLITSGIQPQEVVAIYSHRSASLVWALLGVMKAGAAFVILDPAYPPSRLVDCLRMAQPRGWLQLEASGVLPDALEEFVSSLPCRSCRLELPHRTAAAERKLLSRYDADDPEIAVGPDDLAYVAFTSGTTGRPKGILGKHGSLTHFLPWLKETFGLSDFDRFSMLSGLSHDPLHRDVFTPLQLGATICIPDQKSLEAPGLLSRWMRQEKISVAHLTPAMGQLLTESTPGSSLTRIESLRYAFFIGDVLTKVDVSRLRMLSPSVTCINFYGTTETQRAVGYFIASNEGDVRLEDSATTNLEKMILPIGRGIEDVQLLLLNASQQLAGIGEIAEIYLRSPHLAKGYLDDDALTKEKFITNPFSEIEGDRLYKTGDLGRYLPDGNVEPLGRADQQVKIRGFRIELGEIEAALATHPLVAETVVVAREDTPGNKRLVAYVVVHQEAVLNVTEMRSYLKEKLPDYMLPAALMVLAELPLTPNGKVDRRALPAPEVVQPLSEKTYVAPRTPVEERVAGIWSEVLGVSLVGLHDNFFDLGGHSLLALQVSSRMREAFHIELPLRIFFTEAATVIGFCEAIGRYQIEQATKEEIAEMMKDLEELSDDQVNELLASEGMIVGDPE